MSWALSTMIVVKLQAKFNSYMESMWEQAMESMCAAGIVNMGLLTDDGVKRLSWAECRAHMASYEKNKGDDMTLAVPNKIDLICESHQESWEKMIDERNCEDRKSMMAIPVESAYSIINKKTKGEKMKGMVRVELGKSGGTVLLSELQPDALILGCKHGNQFPSVYLIAVGSTFSCHHALSASIDGFHATRELCMENAMARGYKFFTTDDKSFTQEVLLEEPDTVRLGELDSEALIFAYEDSAPKGVMIVANKFWQIKTTARTPERIYLFDSRPECFEAAVKDGYTMYINERRQAPLESSH